MDAPDARACVAVRAASPRGGVEPAASCRRSVAAPRPRRRTGSRGSARGYAPSRPRSGAHARILLEVRLGVGAERAERVDAGSRSRRASSGARIATHAAPAWRMACHGPRVARSTSAAGIRGRRWRSLLLAASPCVWMSRGDERRSLGVDAAPGSADTQDARSPVRGATIVSVSAGSAAAESDAFGRVDDAVRSLRERDAEADALREPSTSRSTRWSLGIVSRAVCDGGADVVRATPVAILPMPGGTDHDGVITDVTCRHGWALCDLRRAVKPEEESR